MASPSFGPDKVKITVPPGKVTSYNGVRYGDCCKAGNCFWVPFCIAHLYQEDKKEEYPDGCFPDRVCDKKGAWNYVGAYSDLYFLPAETPVIAAIPVIEGCARPACVEFVTCGGCLLVDFDTPVAMPDGPITGGIGPHVNPSMMQLCNNTVADIHMVSGVDTLVNLYFWGNCC